MFVCHWSVVIPCPHLLSSLQTLVVIMDDSASTLEHYSHPFHPKAWWWVSWSDWSQNPAQQPGDLSPHSMDDIYVVPLEWCYIMSIPLIKYTNTCSHNEWIYFSLGHHSHPKGVVRGSGWSQNLVQHIWYVSAIVGKKCTIRRNWSGVSSPYAGSRWRLGSLSTRPTYVISAL